MRIGFIGVGVMGAPMARNLLKAGNELVVHNRSQRPVDMLVAEGARAASTPRSVAEQTDVVITMLPDSPDVLRVYTGTDSLLDGVKQDQVLIDMSTIAPAVAREVASLAQERRASPLDAPVSGGERGAHEGTLSIMVGGAEEAFSRALPTLQELGRTIVHVGPSGAGQVVKACNQVVVAMLIEAASEALVLGSKAGVEPSKIVEVLSGGLAANRLLEARAQNFLQHDFTPGFRAELHAKDLRIALNTARELGVSLLCTAVVEQLMEVLCARGHGASDHSSLLTITEELSQHEIGRGRGEERAGG